jgi:septum formation protein
MSVSDLPHLPSIILASASPRRLSLLEQVGVSVKVLAQDIDESVLKEETPAIYVQRVAQAKAKATLLDSRYDGVSLILAADTSVVLGNEILGKPADIDEAALMLRKLSGREHQVLTAVCLTGAYVDGEMITKTVLSCSKVRFKHLKETEISFYLQSGEYHGKAGAYAIQGLGAFFVCHLQGSYSAVMGLPLFETAQLLEEFGVSLTSIVSQALSSQNSEEGRQ